MSMTDITVQIMPAPDWIVLWRVNAPDEKWNWAPVVAFGTQLSGAVVPMIAVQGGIVAMLVNQTRQVKLVNLHSYNENSFANVENIIGLMNFYASWSTP